MSGYVIMSVVTGSIVARGLMTSRAPKYYAAGGRNIGTWNENVSKAVVYTQADALAKINTYEMKRWAAELRVVPDPMGRKPMVLDKYGNAPIGAENYFEHTQATFKRVAYGEEAFAMWQKLKGRGRLDHVSDYGSEYIIAGDVLYRYADHWGRFASVIWLLDPPTPVKYNGPMRGKEPRAIGMVRFSEMKKI